MEVIEINASKLVFLLDKCDKEKYHITEAAPSQKEGYLRLIRDSGLGTVFLSRVLVQIFELKNGGCEMFVTRLSDDGDNAFEKKDHIYIFKGLGDMLSALIMLKSADLTGGCAYYDERENAYYLALEDECRYIGEFLGKKCRNAPAEYLAEHCTLISDSAIEKLSQFA